MEMLRVCLIDQHLLFNIDMNKFFSILHFKAQNDDASNYHKNFYTSNHPTQFHTYRNISGFHVFNQIYILWLF